MNKVGAKSIVLFAGKGKRVRVFENDLKYESNRRERERDSQSSTITKKMYYLPVYTFPMQ